MDKMTVDGILETIMLRVVREEDYVTEAKLALAKLFHEAVPGKKVNTTGSPRNDEYINEYNQAINQTHKNIDEMMGVG